MEQPVIDSVIPALLTGVSIETYVIIMVSAAFLCFVVSEITRNYSQVDKLWSIMPVLYSMITLLAFPSPRVALMTLLVAVWGFRLSYNFWRKGGYSLVPWRGEEDYRWAILRSHPDLQGRLRFGLFNLLFISFYQHFLILLFCSPIFIAAQNPGTKLNYIDSLGAALMLLFIITETIADNQQYRFYKLKKSGGKGSREFQASLKKGFLSEGLWKHARHPNFASEQAIWLSFYLFSIAASGKWLNWSISGATLLVLLFAGSSHFTEKISSEKYPGYVSYIKTVPKFIPSIFRKGK